MTAQALVIIISTHHHRHGVPTNQGANSALHKQIAGHSLFGNGRDGIDVRSGNNSGKFDPGINRAGFHLCQQEGGSLFTTVTDNRTVCV